tara:strand:- start:4262 stop:4654 length:393 start_codon:yes stop_codon:yes gene_type:complete
MKRIPNNMSELGDYLEELLGDNEPTKLLANSELSLFEKLKELDEIGYRVVEKSTTTNVKDTFWRDAKKELPKKTKGSYSDVDVFICRMYRYDTGRTKDGKWVNMKNEPIDDVVLWAYIPKIKDEFKECFK